MTANGQTKTESEVQSTKSTHQKFTEFMASMSTRALDNVDPSIALDQLPFFSTDITDDADGPSTNGLQTQESPPATPSVPFRPFSCARQGAAQLSNRNLWNSPSHGSYGQSIFKLGSQMGSVFSPRTLGNPPQPAPRKYAYSSHRFNPETADRTDLGYYGDTVPIYRPLSDVVNCTRVFDLNLRTSFLDPLSCTLRTVSLYQDQTISRDESKKYVALSYAWGETGPDRATVPLDCGRGNNLEIGTNLSEALESIQRLWKRWQPYGMEKKQIPTLWTDAICINQRDGWERFMQVMSMRKIYRNAQALIIWLGSMPNTEHRTLLSRLERDGVPDIIAETPMEVLRDLCADILSRDWFYRRWILQEVAVSDKPYADSATVRVTRY